MLMQEGKQADPQAGSQEDRLEVAGWRAGSQACRQAGWQISKMQKYFSTFHKMHINTRLYIKIV